MSILNDIADGTRSIYRLFYPRLCPVCQSPIESASQLICTSCLVDAPLTGFETLANNPVAERVWNMIPIERGCSMLYYVHEGLWRNLAYEFKFRGGWRRALQMGQMMGQILAQSPLWAHIDSVAAIPLHNARTLSRGYNQSEYLAEGIAKALNIKHIRGAIRRKVNNPPQRLADKELRWDNVKDVFEVSNPQALRGRHLLLVDDIFTTGATIISCGEAILRAVPDCHISIATLFASKQEVGIND